MKTELFCTAGTSCCCEPVDRATCPFAKAPEFGERPTSFVTIERIAIAVVLVGAALCLYFGFRS